MYQTIDLEAFRAAFVAADLTDFFSDKGYEVLFNYLEETGNVELDVISFCNHYIEATTEGVVEDFGLIVRDGEVATDVAREFLDDHTTICGEFRGSFIYVIFDDVGLVLRKRCYIPII